MNKEPQEILIKVMCSERLPSKKGSYQVFTNTGIYTDYFNGKRFVYDIQGNVIAWYEPATRVVLTVEEYENIKERYRKLGYLEAREDMDEERDADDLY